MASFYNLEIDANYDIIDGNSGYWITQGIQGSDAMSERWPVDAEAWPAGESRFDGQAIEIAE